MAGMILKDADTYTRLPGQIRYYDRYYDRNYIVIGSTHAAHAAEHVPDYWGIISVELIQGHIDFYHIREAVPNPKVQMQNKLSLLWKSELSHIQERNCLPKWANKSRKFIGEKLMERVPLDILQREICEELFQRYYTIHDGR
jgi:hypothetical protein